MRKKTLIGLAALIAVLALVYVAIFSQAPSAPVESSPLGASSPEDTPPNLLVIPEVPLGTFAVMVACFSAFVISQIKPRSKPR